MRWRRSGTASAWTERRRSWPVARRPVAVGFGFGPRYCLPWRKRRAGPKARPPRHSDRDPADAANPDPPDAAAAPRPQERQQRSRTQPPRSNRHATRQPRHAATPRHPHHRKHRHPNPPTTKSRHETPPKPRTASDHRQPAARGRPPRPPEGPRRQARGGRRDAPDRQGRAWIARPGWPAGIRGAQSKDPARGIGTGDRPAVRVARRDRRPDRCLKIRDSLGFGSRYRFPPRRGRPARRARTAPRVRRARRERAARRDARRFPWPRTPNELLSTSHVAAI